MSLTTLRKRADFLAANRGIRVARPGFVLLVNRNAASAAGKADAGATADAGKDRAMRFGITVTKKIGNAVVRNRMKRRFRELLRAALPTEGIVGADHVLIGREGGVERDFAKLRQELAEALARAAQGKGDPPRRKHSGKHSGKHPSKPGSNRQDNGKTGAAPAPQGHS